MCSSLNVHYLYMLCMADMLGVSLLVTKQLRFTFSPGLL